MQEELVRPPQEEFSRFCEGRLEGIRLAHDNHIYELYCKAVEKGKLLLEPKKSVGKAKTDSVHGVQS